jgi:hypothetical protein
MLEAAAITAIISSVLPGAMDWIGALVNRWTGGAGALPKNVDEVIKLKQAEVAQIEALAKLDQPGPNVSAWVANLRASFRPIIAISSLAVAVIATFTTGLPPEALNTIYMFASSVTAYLFGERMWFGMKGTGKNK